MTATEAGTATFGVGVSGLVMPGGYRRGRRSAVGDGAGENAGVIAGQYAFLLGPFVALLVVGALSLILRWAFSRGHSVVARPGRPGAEDEYGLLVAIASPPTYIEGEMARRRLEDAGVRATLAETVQGPRLMVFPQDESRARKLLSL